jgi:hypothetical protein
MVPTQDKLGNPLIPLADYAHQYVMSAIRDARTWVEYGKAHPPETFDHLKVVAPDTPETDSMLKQVGVYVGELANVPVVTVLKSGKNGPQPWDLSNPGFQPGAPAESLVQVHTNDSALGQPDSGQPGVALTPDVDAEGLTAR